MKQLWWRDFNGFRKVLAKLREPTSTVRHPEMRNDGKALQVAGWREGEEIEQQTALRAWSWLALAWISLFPVNNYYAYPMHLSIPKVILFYISFFFFWSRFNIYLLKISFGGLKGLFPAYLYLFIFLQKIYLIFIKLSFPSYGLALYKAY